MDPNPTRNEVRLAAVLPVRIYGIDAAGKPFNSVAHTLNVSKSGALLANVDTVLNVGDIIGVQKGLYKSKFRVTWVGRKASSSQGQLGITCVEGAKNIWGMTERPQARSNEEMGAQRRMLAGGGFPRERRNAPRHTCDIGVQIRQESAEVSLWSRCTDISEGGCYIDSRAPLPPGTQFQLTMFLGPDPLVVPVVVRTSFAGIGMGVQFAFESQDQQVQLRCAIRQKFGGTEEASSDPQDSEESPALAKLAECVEQLRAWSKATAIEEADREELERLAHSLRRELQGIRAEINERVIQRRTKNVAAATSA